MYESHSKNTKVLVTGGTGHIGNVLVRQLLAQSERVRTLILPGEDCSPLSGLDVEKVVGDVLEPDTLRRAFQGVRDVFHLAGVISIMSGRNSEVRSVNVDGTRNMIRQAHASGVKRLVYTSSIHAIQRAPHGVTIDESTPFDVENAISAYDRSKAEASLLVQDAACLGLNAVIACPTGVIGPFDFRISDMGKVILGAMRNQPQVYIDGAYDFVDVRDVAQGLLLAREKGRRGESYILSGEQLGYRQIIEMVKKTVSLPIRLLKIPLSLARIAGSFAPLYFRLTNRKPRLTSYSIATITSNSVISNAKACRELGYSHRPMAGSIIDTVHWFIANTN